MNKHSEYRTKVQVKNKGKTSREIPKVVELVNALASFLDSGTDYGSEFSMTKLKKQIALKKSHPHLDTIRSKITEGFIFKNVLKEWEETYRDDGLVDRMRKIKPNEVNLATILDYLIQIKTEIEELKKEVNKVT